MAGAPFGGSAGGSFCNHFAQLGFLCALEMTAGSCIWWAHSEDFATLQKPKARPFAWHRKLTAKSGGAQAQRLISQIDKTRRLLGLAILIIAGCYLSGSAIYTVAIARGHHRKHMAETKVDKLTDSWLVRIAIPLYLLVASPALLLSAWLGYGVYFGPKVALKVFALSFEQPRRGVHLFVASATIIFITLIWRIVSLCHDIHQYSLKKSAQPADIY